MLYFVTLLKVLLLMTNTDEYVITRCLCQCVLVSESEFPVLTCDFDISANVISLF